MLVEILIYQIQKVKWEIWQKAKGIHANGETFIYLAMSKLKNDLATCLDLSYCGNLYPRIGIISMLVSLKMPLTNPGKNLADCLILSVQ